MGIISAIDVRPKNEYAIYGRLVIVANSMKVKVVDCLSTMSEEDRCLFCKITHGKDEKATPLLYQVVMIRS